MAECRPFVAEGGADAKAEWLGFGGGVGVFGDDTVDDAVCEQVRGPHSLFGRHRRSVASVVVKNRAGPLGGKWGKPSVLCGEDPVGRHQRECSAAGALPEKH